MPPAACVCTVGTRMPSAAYGQPHTQKERGKHQARRNHDLSRPEGRLSEHRPCRQQPERISALQTRRRRSSGPHNMPAVGCKAMAAPPLPQVLLPPQGSSSAPGQRSRATPGPFSVLRRDMQISARFLLGQACEKLSPVPNVRRRRSGQYSPPAGRAKTSSDGRACTSDMNDLYSDFSSSPIIRLQGWGRLAVPHAQSQTVPGNAARTQRNTWQRSEVRHSDGNTVKKPCRGTATAAGGNSQTGHLIALKPAWNDGA